MKDLTHLMKEIGLVEDAPVRVKEALIKHLVKGLDQRIINETEKFTLPTPATQLSFDFDRGDSETT